MNLLRITVPTTDNDGNPNPVRPFEEFLLATFGGFTRSALQGGAWRSDDGRIFERVVRTYDIAVKPPWPMIPRLRRAFFQYFPDQLTVFIAEIGTAENYARPTARVGEAADA